MNYIFYFKKQVIFYIAKVLVFIMCGGITCYFRCGKLIGLMDLIDLLFKDYNFTIFISYSLTFIFLIPFYLMWLIYPKK